MYGSSDVCSSDLHLLSIPAGRQVAGDLLVVQGLAVRPRHRFVDGDQRGVAGHHPVLERQRQGLGADRRAIGVGTTAIEPVLDLRQLGACPDRGDAWCSGQVAEGEALRSEEHTSELQSLMRISYAVLCLKKKNR